MKTSKLFIILILITGLSESIAIADFVFGEPAKVPNLNSSSGDGGPHISFDGLELYFTSGRPNGVSACSEDIWVARRSTTQEPWSAPVKLDAAINSDMAEASPCISADGLELYFTDNWSTFYGGATCANPDGYGDGDLWVSKRATKDDTWGGRENLGPTVNSASWEDNPSISADGLSLYFISDRPEGHGASDLYVTTRQTKNDPWDLPINLGSPINTSNWEMCPHISSDGLSLYFASSKLGTSDIFVSRRATTTDPWGEPVELLAVNSSQSEFFLTFSVECSTIYFSRGSQISSGAVAAWATYDIWQVEVTPIVDFNGDGIVDVADVTIMVDNWHTDNTLCDIAPAPLGDGFVDVQDLMVLAEHLFEEENPPAQ